jgi:hypothetical protein
MPSFQNNIFSIFVYFVYLIIKHPICLHQGFLGNQNVGISVDDVEDYESEQSATYDRVSRRRKSFGRKKPNPRDWDDNEDNWELPMDYL